MSAMVDYDVVDENASVRIGRSVYFNEGMMLSAKKEIKIGADASGPT